MAALIGRTMRRIPSEDELRATWNELALVGSYDEGMNVPCVRLAVEATTRNRTDKPSAPLPVDFKRCAAGDFDH